MPIYEYRCLDCRRKVSIFFRRMGEEEGAACPVCGGRRLERLFSRFALARSEEDRLERLADDASLADIDESDPKSLARFMRRMGRELGEEGGEEFEEALEELERGELPGEEAGEGGAGEEGGREESRAD
jgi:putative FmdB family regulatory protein